MYGGRGKDRPGLAGASAGVSAGVLEILPHSFSLMCVPCACVTCLSVAVASEHACSRVHNTHPPTYAHMCTLARTHAHMLDDFTGKHQSGDCPIRAAKGGGLHGNTRVGHGMFIELPLGLGLRKRRPHVCSYVHVYVRTS